MASMQLSQQRRGAGRFPHKQREILITLAKQIQKGDLEPGARLPVREELCQQFETTTTTVQRAIDNMVADGFLETKPRQGTFVAMNPPCCFRYGIAFPSEIDGRGWRGLDTSILQVAKQVASQSRFSFMSYGGFAAGAGSEIVAELIDDLTLKRIAGVIFSSAPYMLVNTPVLDLPDVSRISVQTAKGKYNFPIVDFEGNVFIPKAVDFLKSKGCKRIGLITQSEGNAFQIENFQTALSYRGMQTDSAFIQGVPLTSPRWAVNLTQLMLHAGHEHRPDGLLIMDDTLTPYVLKGVDCSSCRLEDDLHIVSHCNFPDTGSSSLPVTRIGFDIRELFTHSLQTLWAQQTGQPYPEKRTLEIKFEDDINKSTLEIPDPFKL